MLAEFKHTLRRKRGAIIGWSIGIGLYSLMMVSLYDSIGQIEGFEDVIASYPPELMAFFGDMTNLTTPPGYMGTYFFSYMHLIVGVFTISAGASLLAGDEEDGILDLVLSYPVSRSGLFWGRVLGFLVAVLIILLVGYLSWLLPSGSTGLDLTWLEILRPFGPLLMQLLLFAALALFLSMVLPSKRLAAGLTGAILVADFLVQGLAELNDSLQSVVEYLPLYYYQSGDAIKNSLNWTWLGGLLAGTLLLTLLAWFLFRRRDIRVGGERSLQLPGWLARLWPGRHAAEEPSDLPGLPQASGD